MKSMPEQFDEVLAKVGNAELKHPVFYNAPVGIRFEIGNMLPIILDGNHAGEHVVHPLYIDSALQRAVAIYEALPHAPNILRVDTYPQDKECEYCAGSDLRAVDHQLPFPHAQRTKCIAVDGVDCTVVQLYWDLKKLDFSPEILLKEIIKADFGSILDLASNVYFVNTEDVYLYHVYDDRGADLVAENREVIRPVYYEFHQWILECDREQIKKQFAKWVRTS